MPDWLRDIGIAIGAFIGGRAVNAVGEQMKEGRELRRGVDRLTQAVETVSSDLRDIRGEIHNQVAGLKVELHDQVSGLRYEIANHKAENDQRVNSIDSRIDALSSGVGLLTGPAVRAVRPPFSRLDQERGCYPLMGEEPET